MSRGSDQRPDRGAEALGDRWATDADPTVAGATDTTAHLNPFSWGVLADAYNIGRRLWWLKRARDFENAKPLPGDFHGSATREELSRRWRWCDEVARACRAKAEMVGVDEELEAVLRAVA